MMTNNTLWSTRSTTSVNHVGTVLRLHITLKNYFIIRNHLHYFLHKHHFELSFHHISILSHSHNQLHICIVSNELDPLGWKQHCIHRHVSCTGLQDSQHGNTHLKCLLSSHQDTNKRIGLGATLLQLHGQPVCLCIKLSIRHLVSATIIDQGNCIRSDPSLLLDQLMEAAFSNSILGTCTPFKHLCSLLRK